MKTKGRIPTPKQLPSGAWRCQIRVDGRAYSVTDPDRSKCLAKAMALKTGLLQRAKNPLNMTLRQAANEIISSLEGRRSPTTIAGYRKILRNDFETILDRKLCHLTPRLIDLAVQDMCTRTTLSGKPLSPKTIRNNWMFLKMVLDEYVPDLKVKIRLPEVKRSVTILSQENEIIRAIIGTPVELPCLLAAWMSLSMSEIKGLTKSRSLRGDYLLVGAETVVRVDGREIRKAGGKEATRTRALKLPDYIRHLIDQVDGDVIVPDPASTITGRFYRILEAHGLPHLKFHGLRHLNASIMGELGVDRATARERGGWANNTIMDSVYTHSLESAKEDADRRINERFLRVINGHG